MSVTISDETLQQTGLSERELLTELACFLFDRGRVHLWPAARLAGLTRVEFERELHARGLPIYRITPEEFERDLRSLRESESQRCRSS